MLMDGRVPEAKGDGLEMRVRFTHEGRAAD